jgi:hypothetical protein
MCDFIGISRNAAIGKNRGSAQTIPLETNSPSVTRYEKETVKRNKHPRNTSRDHLLSEYILLKTRRLQGTLFGDRKADTMVLKSDTGKNYNFRSRTFQYLNFVFRTVYPFKGKLNYLGHFLSPQNRHKYFHINNLVLSYSSSATLFLLSIKLHSFLTNS